MNISVDVVALAGVVSALLVLVTGFNKIYQPLKKQLDRMDKIERWVAKQQRDIEDSKKERSLTLSGLLAALEHIRETEPDSGVVSETISAMKVFMIQAAHKGVSYDPDEDATLK